MAVYNSRLQPVTPAHVVHEQQVEGATHSIRQGMYTPDAASLSHHEPCKSFQLRLCMQTVGLPPVALANWRAICEGTCGAVQLCQRVTE